MTIYAQCHRSVTVSCLISYLNKRKLTAPEQVAYESLPDLIPNCLKEEHKGKDKAVFSRELEEMSGIGDRDVRRHISALRKEGKPICSDFHKGYYYADSQEDVAGTVGRLSDYVSGLLGLITGLRTSKVKEPQGIKITITIETDEAEDGEPELSL